MDIKSMTIEELSEVLRGLGQPGTARSSSIRGCMCGLRPITGR